MTEPASPHRQPEEGPRHGRLSARPAAPTTRGATGLVPVTAPDGGPPALAYAPPGDGPYRLVVLLHGAGGTAQQGLDLLLPLADAHRLLLLAPKATASSWDLIVEAFGTDVTRIDGLLGTVFGAYPVAEVAFGGFSDGASYALSLGLTNGDLVDAVLAFSPASPRRWCRTAGRAPSSRTAPTTGCCRWTCAAGGWCPGCTPSATRWSTPSSPAATRCRRRSGSGQWPGSPVDVGQAGPVTAASTRSSTVASSSTPTPRSRSIAVARS